MSSEFLTPQDVVDTISGIDRRAKERAGLYAVPTWIEVVNAMSRYAYKEVYGEIPSIDNGMYEYVEFTQYVDNIIRQECGSCVEELIPLNATPDDAIVFNRRFSEWRENAIDKISPEDESPELRESVLYGVSIDTLAAFANRTIEQIDGALGRPILTESHKLMYQDLRGKWEARSSFLETARRVSMDLSAVL